MSKNKKYVVTCYDFSGCAFFVSEPVGVFKVTSLIVDCVSHNYFSHCDVALYVSEEAPADD